MSTTYLRNSYLVEDFKALMIGAKAIDRKSTIRDFKVKFFHRKWVLGGPKFYVD